MYSLSHTQSFHNGLIQKHLGYLLETGAFSDMKMLVKDGLEFNLHKAVVSLLLSESVLITGTTGTIIQMDFMPVHIARSLISLLYTGQSMLETEDDLQTFKKIASVLKFAHKVQIAKSSDSTTKLALEEKTESENTMDALISNFKEEPELRISDNLSLDSDKTYVIPEEETKVHKRLISKDHSYASNKTSVIPQNESQTQAINTPKNKSNATFMISPKKMDASEAVKIKVLKFADQKPIYLIPINQKEQSAKSTNKAKSTNTGVKAGKHSSVKPSDIINNNAVNIETQEYVASDESIEDEEKIIKKESEPLEDKDKILTDEKESELLEVNEDDIGKDIGLTEKEVNEFMEENPSLFSELNSALPNTFLDLVKDIEERQQVEPIKEEEIDIGILDELKDEEVNMLAKFQKYKLFFCSLCDNKCFKSGQNLKEHHRSIHKDHEMVEDECLLRPFQCTECDSTFAIPQSIWTHMIERHSGKRAKIICPKVNCGKPFMNRAMMLTHAQKCKITADIDIDERCKFHCPECYEKFKRLLELADHFCKIHPSLDLTNYDIDKYPYKCKSCDQGFGNLICLKNHLRQHKDAKYEEFKCDIDDCDKTFQTRGKKNEHKRKFHKIVKANPRRQRRNNHLYLKDPKNCVKCPICKEIFSDRQGVLKHVTIVHKDIQFEKFKEEFDRESAYVCTYCGKKYLKKQPFEDHIKTVHEKIDEKVPCQVCGKTFMSNGRMMGHYYSAHYYGYKRSSFIRRDGTVRATKIKVENNPGPRKLEKPERFYNLETNECKLCHKIINKDRRKKHYLSMHDPERHKRRLQCPHCDFTCKVQEALKQHVEFQHTEWKIFCQICERKFANGYERNRHMKKAHNMIYMILCLECKFIWKKVGNGRAHGCPNQLLETIFTVFHSGRYPK